MTNGERLRQMTDEELGKWISLRVNCVFCDLDKECIERCEDKECFHVYADWLKQESEDTE